ncbi:MAG: GntR family transcriptional regulator [Holdemania filiformis]
MFTIDPRSRQPIYEQLKEQIIRYVSLGVLQPLDRCPLCGFWRGAGINPNTVVKTYQELEDEGILITEPKKGFCQQPRCMLFYA